MRDQISHKIRYFSGTLPKLNTKSDMSLTSKHCEEKESLPEEKQEQTHDFQGSEQRLRIDTIDSVDDDFPYQFNYYISVAIIEEETDQVELAFLDSVKEIKKEVNLLLARAHCEKICKSKGRLTKYINSKRKEARDIATSEWLNQIPLCQGTIVSIIQSVKTDLP